MLVSTCKEELSEHEFISPVWMLQPEAGFVRGESMLPGDLDDASHIIICGTALADFEYLKWDWSWIRSCNKPILGICAGAQVIAKEFGWNLVKTQRIGVQQVKRLKNNPLFEKDANAYFLHSYDISGGEVLAASAGVPAVLKVKDKPIFACVFHPEVMNDEIIRNFLKLSDNS